MARGWGEDHRGGRLAWLAVGLATVVALALAWDIAGRISATYDEVAYLEIAARWWRTGEQDAITRMGSPLTFWKLQSVPAFAYLEATGHPDWIDDPIGHQAELLPAVRRSGLWVWAVGLIATATWAGRLHGPSARAFAAWLFAVGPNLLAHGSLATMEGPIVAASAATFALFSRFLDSGRTRWFVASAVACGLAFSCKFTAVAFPGVLALAWIGDRLSRGDRSIASIRRVVGPMAGFGMLMIATNLAATGLATIAPSESTGPHPSLDGSLPGAIVQLAERRWPRDWVAFAVQLRHQRSGGPSYLLGERRQFGWRSYYPIALAVKLPLGVIGLLLARIALGRRVDPEGRGRTPLLLAVGFLALACLGSTRNYGVRYLLPIAPAAIVWLSALAAGGLRTRMLAVAGLGAVAVATARSHPHELTFFNATIGGVAGGRQVLADSNLDWGQGAYALARLQRQRPEFRDVTLYAFGATDPTYYGVVGTRHVIDAGTDHPGLPPRLVATTPFLAVSASLRWGPWGPPGYFRPLERIEPVASTDDGTIAIYRTADLAAAAAPPTPSQR